MPTPRAFAARRWRQLRPRPQMGGVAAATLAGVLVLSASGSAHSVTADHAPVHPAATVATIVPVAQDRDRPARLWSAPTPPPSVTPMLPTPAVSVAPVAVPDASALASDGIPATAEDAYVRATAREARLDPACGIPWTLVAAIGRVESDHGRFAGAVLRVDGTSSPRIIGIALDGTRSALILDTDHGLLDGDQVYDHAIGPMQFIPASWARYGVDGNGDKVIDPFNIYDAAAATAHYLCVAGGDLHDAAGMARAVFSYNHLDTYVNEVLALQASYAGTPPKILAPVPLPTGTPSPTTVPTLTSVPTPTCSTAPTATPSTTAGSSTAAASSGTPPPSASASVTPTGTPTGSPAPSASSTGHCLS